MFENLVVLLEKIGLGAIIGFCIGLTGIGGGVLVLPSLTLLVGLPASTTVGTANLYAFLCRVPAFYHHWRRKSIDYTSSVWLLFGAVPANLAVSILINRYVNSFSADPQAFSRFQLNLQRFMAFVVTASAVLLMFLVLRRNRKNGDNTELLSQTRRALHSCHVRYAAALGLGTVVGALIGSTSVGGGVVIVPLLIIVFGLSPARTVGSSILIAVVLALFSSLIYGISSQLDAVTSTVMAFGSLFSVPIGSRLSIELPPAYLQLIVASIVLLSGVVMFINQLH